jgi:translation initiation factor IF-2
MLMVLLKHYLIHSLNYLLKKFKLILYIKVGAITETDVMLASASDAIIIGFNVVLQEMQDSCDKEEIDIRYYSIIYAAIDEDAMECLK